MSCLKILAVTDQIVDSLHSPNVKNRFGDVDGIISCGDLPYGYLDYLVTVLGKPLYFVHGNHDKDYEYTENGRRQLAPQGVIRGTPPPNEFPEPPVSNHRQDRGQHGHHHGIPEDGRVFGHPGEVGEAGF